MLFVAFYLSVLYSAVTSVVMPPLGVKRDVIFIHLGLQAAVRSSRISFVKAS